ncbi:hypothetical protein PAESOLCIP111_03719 [Paenibacillus solanacearum]|uniref:Sulfatase N-terminal domain-containing protein n=1 Tax=Paenibacillus solanacearum TaxID=2048548 RepID=A0A916K5W8_9BACL|nr:hypothetical protein PAESOLCIP111_03719 [Paenibacillus solanacearum]
MYADADRLDAYGFAGWIGPEPHGRNPRNSASSAAIGVSGRDETYVEETTELIEALDRQRLAEREAQPWLIVASFVNPHDIVLYGALTAHLPAFRFAVDPMPEVPPSPTFDEPLHTKPRCQASYRDLYPYAFQPILDEPFYRKLYYQLQKNADQQIARVLEALTRSSFYDNTIVVFTSDHGELLGAHGGLRQKWYCAYEEMLHVPFIIHNRRLFPQPQQCHALTSHVDLMPTLLGLANADAEAIRERLRSKFSEARSLVGRDLSAVIREPDRVSLPDEPIYFMSDDDVTRGLHQCNALGMPYPSVAQPNHVETIIMTVTHNSKKQRWKLSRYFDPTQFWSCPGVSDTASSPVGPAYGPVRCWNVSVKTKPAEDEFELYNLSDDPLETVNLAHPSCATPTTIAIQRHMMALLAAQRKHKRLQPATYHT